MEGWKKERRREAGAHPGMNSGRSTSDRISRGVGNSRMAIAAARPRSGAIRATDPADLERRHNRTREHLGSATSGRRIGERVRKGRKARLTRRDREDERRQERQIDEQKRTKLTYSQASTCDRRALSRIPLTSASSGPCRGSCACRRRDTSPAAGPPSPAPRWSTSPRRADQFSTVHGARDRIAHELIADPTHDDRDGALAEAADETENRRMRTRPEARAASVTLKNVRDGEAPSSQLAWISALSIPAS